VRLNKVFEYLIIGLWIIVWPLISLYEMLRFPSNSFESQVFFVSVISYMPLTFAILLILRWRED